MFLFLRFVHLSYKRLDHIGLETEKKLQVINQDFNSDFIPKAERLKVIFVKGSDHRFPCPFENSVVVPSIKTTVGTREH